MNQNKRAGKVYFGRVKFGNGKSKIYTGQTKRSVSQRVLEHKKSQLTSAKTYVGKGIKFTLLGSIFSKNRFKTEKTCKSLSPKQKLKLAKYGAKNFRKNYY